MIIDADKIKKILDSEVSAYELASRLGISRMMVGKYRSGETDYMKMSLEVAGKFMNYKEVNMSKIKITGLKKAISDFNDWQGTARIYFNTDDATVWTNVYPDQNNFDCHHSATIYEVYSKATRRMDERDNKITMRQLRQCCEEVCDG